MINTFCIILVANGVSPVVLLLWFTLNVQRHNDNVAVWSCEYVSNC